MKEYIPKLKEVDENTLRNYVKTLNLKGEVDMLQLCFYNSERKLVAKKNEYGDCYIWDGESFEEIDVDSYVNFLLIYSRNLTKNKKISN